PAGADRGRGRLVRGAVYATRRAGRGRRAMGQPHAGDPGVLRGQEGARRDRGRGPGQGEPGRGGRRRRRGYAGLMTEHQREVKPAVGARAPTTGKRQRTEKFTLGGRRARVYLERSTQAQGIAAETDRGEPRRSGVTARGDGTRREPSRTWPGGGSSVSENNKATTRRALLAAAAGGAAALAAQAAVPLAAQGHDPDDVALGATNAATAATEIDATGAGVNAFVASAAAGSAVVATSTGAAGINAHETDDLFAAVYAIGGDRTNAAAVGDTAATGIYGFTPTPADPTAFGSGVWGDSGDAGVVGTGGLGVLGLGNFGVEGDGFGTGGTGVFGYAGGPGTIGVQAFAASTDRVALKVTGKAQFTRSGRAT